MGIGTTELLIILAIVVLIFGASKLPQLGAGLGKGIQNFKKSARGDDEADELKVEKTVKTVKKDDTKEV
jgi:sec-independent protein translocase protein TatA